MERYHNYTDLKRHEALGVDYEIIARNGPSSLAFMAPHGGGIEPGTAEIADRAAGSEYTFYAFKGLKKKGNRALHIRSKGFDEPIALKIARRAETVVTIHGCRGEEDTVYIGGRNMALMIRIKDLMTGAGFEAEFIRESALGGRHPDNICNQCRSGQGLQLELPRGLREKMIQNLGRRSRRRKNPLFFRFVHVLRKAFRDRFPV